MVMMKDSVYFVWVMSNGQAWPEKRYGVHTDGHGKRGIVAYSRLLDETEVNLSLDKLVKIYPYERKDNEE